MGECLGYIRVSTVLQHEDRQVEMLRTYVSDEHMYIDKASGLNTDRPKLKEMLAYMRKGDTVYIESISRLARNTLDFLKLVELFREKQVHLISIKEHIDTTSPSGILIITVLAAIYQMEIAYMKERQREGIALAKQRGVYKGRKRKRPPSFDYYYKQWKDGNMSALKCMKAVGVSSNTWYKLSKEKEAQAGKK